MPFNLDQVEAALLLLTCFLFVGIFFPGGPSAVRQNVNLTRSPQSNNTFLNLWPEFLFNPPKSGFDIYETVHIQPLVISPLYKGDIPPASS